MSVTWEQVTSADTIKPEKDACQNFLGTQSCCSAAAIGLHSAKPSNYRFPHLRLPVSVHPVERGEESGPETNTVTKIEQMSREHEESSSRECETRPAENHCQTHHFQESDIHPKDEGSSEDEGEASWDDAEDENEGNFGLDDEPTDEGTDSESDADWAEATRNGERYQNEFGDDWIDSSSSDSSPDSDYVYYASDTDMGSGNGSDDDAVDLQSEL